MIGSQQLAILCGQMVGGWIFALCICAPVLALASDLAIKNVHVFEAHDGFEDDTRSVVVRNGTIFEVLENEVAIPSKLKVIDGGGDICFPASSTLMSIFWFRDVSPFPSFLAEMFNLIEPFPKK